MGDEQCVRTVSPWIECALGLAISLDIEYSAGYRGTFNFRLFASSRIFDIGT
jgi:hypothetical protein